MAQYNNIEYNNRICYVDPNDVRGHIKNFDSTDERLVPLTPDYPEYCIWCNLIVERSSRLKNQVERENNEGTSIISFDMTNANNGTNFVSFMQGKDADNYNFLTTDYTNIDFDTIRKRNIIEGLQIEKINVSFVNYQTPQVTINFVDIRGGGFFGREEATHNEYGDLSGLSVDERARKMDNLFSCFVSFPYPRFRLQIKGFYGKPVTFQLTCTSFNGRFNSSTGNFEIVVQFIGYEYGILGDIPFDLLIAAPITKTGGQYWDAHVEDMMNNKWSLDKDGTEAPYKLYDFFKNIAKELDSSSEEELDENIVDDSTELFALSANKQIEGLGIIKQYIQEFKQALISTFKPDYITDCPNDAENTVIVYSPTESCAINENLCNKYNNLCTAIDEYNKKYKTENGGISTSLIPNSGKNGKWVEWKPTQVRFGRFMEHKSSNNNGSDVNIVISQNSDGNVTNAPITGESSCCKFKVRKMNANDWYEITPGMSKRIYNDLSSRDWAVYGKDNGKHLAFASYALAINFGPTAKEIDDKITEINENYNKLKTQISEQKGRTIRDIVGFSPYVGRFFKVVMCHLETLVAMFNTFADKIYEELNAKTRKPSDLGIKNLDTETDVPGSEFDQVPPFPAVYSKYVTREEDDKILNEGKNIVAKTWIGDFSGNWQEREMVEELYKAAQRISESRTAMTDTSSELEGMFNSIMPIDYYYGIPNYAYNTAIGAAFYAGLRAEIALNFMQGGKDVSDSDAEILGNYDGYVFAKYSTSKAFIKSLSKDEAFYKNIYDTCVYTNGFKNSEPFIFEFAKVHENRHPLFVEKGSNVKYKYMTNDFTNTEYIPMENNNSPGNANAYSKYYTYETGNDFTAKDDTGSFLVSGSYSSTYEKTHHFGIIRDEGSISKILATYNDLIEGKSQIGGKSASAITNVIKKYTNVDNDEYITNFYNGKTKDYYGNYSSYGIDVNNIGTNPYEKFVSSRQPRKPTAINTTYPSAFSGQQNSVQTAQQIPFMPVEQPEETGDGYIHQSIIYTIDTGGSSKGSSLFSHPFYYHQNGISDINTRNCVKALLFLHSLPFSYEKLITAFYKPFYNSDGNGGIDKIPYGYLLFLGGLIWRKRYVEEHGEDPIQYKHFFEPPENKYAPLFALINGEVRFSVVQSFASGQRKRKWYSGEYSDFLTINGKPGVEKQLVELFENFVENEFNKVMAVCELYKLDVSDNKVKNMGYSDIVFIAKKLNGYNSEKAISALSGNEQFTRTDGDHMTFKVNNFSGNYVCGWSHNTQTKGLSYDSMLQIFYSESSDIQTIFRNLFFGECIASTIPNTVNSNGIPQKVLKSYFNGFVKSVTDYVNNKETQEEISKSEDELNNTARDLKCEIYITLKNLWDRWFCGYYNQDSKYDEIPGREFFEVRNFFCKNFMFIDSFYTNIYDKLKLNCKKLKDMYVGDGITQQTGLGKTVVAYLGSVVSAHRCVMFNFPDNVNFSDTGDRLASRDEIMLQNMKDIFTPFAANKVSNPEYSNKFTIIYTHSAESLEPYGRSKFNTDSFDIWSYDQGTGVAPTIFKSTPSEMEQNSNYVTNESLLSYRVPSFGVAYSRQNNSFWKNINVGMDNFAVTEQSIRTEASIAEKGNSEKHNITFYGQDIYSLYQAYSYLVTVEMMGDAQIQPLMYFQLMNVPMFRGTYMVIKVEHNISQGNMTTVFTGMKMSRVQVPFASSWFTVSDDEKFIDKTQDTSDNGEEMTAIDGAVVDIEDNDLSRAIKKYLNTDGMRCDDFVIKVYKELDVKINNLL